MKRAAKGLRSTVDDMFHIFNYKVLILVSSLVPYKLHNLIWKNITQNTLQIIIDKKIKDKKIRKVSPHN